MKNMAKAIIVLALSALAMTASAQVKQVYQVLDFDTRQPIAGAVSSLYGQQLTTNAKGVAVANLTVDKKGAYLPLEQWKLDGYVQIGRTPESYYTEFQTTDTIKYYLAERDKYRKEVEDLSVQFYRFWYDDAVMDYLNKVKDSIRNHPDEGLTLDNDLVSAVMGTGTQLWWRWIDVNNDVSRYSCYMFEKPQFAEALRVLRAGDVDSAVAMVRRQIDTTDNSRANLEWISLYRKLKELNLGTKDDGQLSNYTRLLYENHYNPDAAVEYILDLRGNLRYNLADSIAQIERPKNRNPRFSAVFQPSPAQYMAPLDKAMLKSTAEMQLNASQKSYHDYPHYKTLGNLYWLQKNLYAVYSLLEDSVSASHTIEASKTDLKQYLKHYESDSYIHNQEIIDNYRHMLNMVKDFPKYISDSIVYDLCNGIYNAAKANYDRDTASLFQKLQLAETALAWLQEAPQMEGGENRRMEIIRQLNDVATSLSKDFPDLFTLQNVQVASQLLASCLMLQCDNEKTLEAFRRYERSFDAVNALYPGTFVRTYQRFNAMVDGYLTASQQFILTDEFTDFTDRLLRIQTGNDPQKFLVSKAEYANGLAESLYKEEAYDEAVGYYMQACEFYEKAIPNDPDLWEPYLRNYLQMGDAHLYQNQYDKAVMTYQKILDFESQIPTSVMPQYIRMKGNVHYYIGDVRKATGDMTAAEKEYKQAEKLFRKAVALGYTDANASMGEMYWGKAVVAAQNKDLKKCRQMVEKSVACYEGTDLRIPLKTYERAKSIMGDFYKEEKNVAGYYRTIADLTDYYRKFYEYGSDYAVGLVQNAEIMLGSENISKEEALTYAHDITNGIIELNDAGEEVDLPYLRSLFNLARVYVDNDSVQQAIDLYKDCLNINEFMFKDTAMSTYQGNMAEVYSKLASCYEMMAEEVDTAHSENWYYRAIDTRDTLIDLMKELNNDGDVNLTYRTAVQYRNNGALFYKLDMVPSAQDYFDKSNELLLMLYNSEYKAEVEDDIIQNYFLKGVVYQEVNNEEKAVQNLRTAIEYGEKLESGEVSAAYVAALAQLIEILGKDKAANAAEIAKLTKQLKEQSKKLK